MKPKLHRTAEANVAAPISSSILLLEYKMHLFALTSLPHLSGQHQHQLISDCCLITSSDISSACFSVNFTSLHFNWSNYNRKTIDCFSLTLSLTVSHWQWLVWPCRPDTSNWEVKLALCASVSRLQPSLSLSSLPLAPGLGTPGFYSAITGPGPSRRMAEAPPHRLTTFSGHGASLAYFAPSAFILVPLTPHLSGLDCLAPSEGSLIPFQPLFLLLWEGAVFQLYSLNYMIV